MCPAFLRAIGACPHLHIQRMDYKSIVCVNFQIFNCIYITNKEKKKYSWYACR